MGKKKGQKPKTLAAVSAAPKKPKAVPHSPHDDPFDRHPTFSFHYANHGANAPCCFRPEGSCAEDLVRFICDMSRSRWKEIRAMTTGGHTGHRKHHEMPVDVIIAEAQDELVARKLDEVMPDELFRFRVSATERLWGFVSDGIFYVLWWDPDHMIYPTDQ